MEVTASDATARAIPTDALRATTREAIPYGW
jgi:hypothetical protein